MIPEGGPPDPPIPRDDFELERKRKFLIDDVPGCIKRSRLQAAPTSGLPALREVAMNAVVHSGPQEWFDQNALDGISTLVQKVVRGVRVHREPRRRLYDHDRHRECNRLSVMLSATGQCAYKDDGASRTNERMENS